MTPQRRILVFLALSFMLGASFAFGGVAPILVALCAVPLGFYLWFWILFGDVIAPWGIFTSQGRNMMSPILAGNTNLGSRSTQILAIIGEVVRAGQALAIGYLTPLFFRVIDPIPTVALLPLLIPVVVWWILN